MWLLPFRTVRRLLARIADAPAAFRGVHRSSVEEVVWAVNLAGRLLPWASTCLSKALTAQVMLSRRAHPAILRIGVVSDEGRRFEAHAWVESAGRAVIGAHELERYTILTSLETSRP